MVKCKSGTASSPDLLRYVRQAKSLVRFAAPLPDASPCHWLCRALYKNILIACFLLLLLVPARNAHAQISPGPLARPHHQFDGPTNCTKCHTQSVRERSFRCVECHREVAAELDQHPGLH